MKSHGIELPLAYTKHPACESEACMSLSRALTRLEDENPVEKTQQTPQSSSSEAIQCKPLEVMVGDRGIERAIKHLKRKMASEGILRELKRRRHYMKPSIKKRKKQSEAARRRRKRARTEV